MEGMFSEIITSQPWVTRKEENCEQKKKLFVRDARLFKMQQSSSLFYQRYSGGQELTEYHDHLCLYFADTTEKRG
jgi:hypothetical protein